MDSATADGATRPSADSTDTRPADAREPVADFTPRASNLAHAIIAAADLTVAEERYARLLADVAGFAKPGDAKRWKVRPGEVFCMLGSGSRRVDGMTTTERHADALGLKPQTLHNMRVALKRQGVIEVRQCDRTRRALVFVGKPFAGRQLDAIA